MEPGEINDGTAEHVENAGEHLKRSERSSRQALERRDSNKNERERERSRSADRRDGRRSDRIVYDRREYDRDRDKREQNRVSDRRSFDRRDIDRVGERREISQRRDNERVTEVEDNFRRDSNRGRSIRESTTDRHYQPRNNERARDSRRETSRDRRDSRGLRDDEVDELGRVRRRHRSPSRSPPRKIRKQRSESPLTVQEIQDKKLPFADVPIETDEEAQFRLMMGFSSFATTKETHVPGTDVSATDLRGRDPTRRRQYKQFMNRTRAIEGADGADGFVAG